MFVGNYKCSEFIKRICYICNKPPLNKIRAREDSFEAKSSKNLSSPFKNLDTF